MPSVEEAPGCSVEIGACRFETSGEIARVEAVDAHSPGARRRVHETVVADIDADVRERCIARVEENQVAGAQIATSDGFPLRAMSAALPLTFRPAAWPKM